MSEYITGEVLAVEIEMGEPGERSITSKIDEKEFLFSLELVKK
jgi:hypothetical protein